MKRLFGLLAIGFAVAFAAESAKEKSPGDVAADAFFKIRDDKDARSTAPASRSCKKPVWIISRRTPRIPGSTA